MKKWGSRWFLMSVLLCALAFFLSVWLRDSSSFTAVATVALGGGHFTNAMERRNPTTDERI